MYQLQTPVAKTAAIVGALTASLIVLPLGGAIRPEARAKADQRLEEAATVFSEIMAALDKEIPRDLLEKSQCVVIVPGLKKGAFGIGAEYGRGFLNCRNEGHLGWSAPAAVRVEGGSVGLQAGGSETDLILLVMNPRGADRLLSSQFTLGVAGELAGGPVGRNSTAQTDAKFTAEILSWSRSRGIFAGLAVQGATLRQDLDTNEALYGSRLENRAIVKERTRAPASARRLITQLNRYSADGKKS